MVPGRHSAPCDPKFHFGSGRVRSKLTVRFFLAEQLVVGSVELEPEAAWLRHRLRRLRAILRRVKDPEARMLLNELITDAEDRVDQLEKIRAQELLK
jgi:bacterioferritin (cytochrome b1)